MIFTIIMKARSQAIIMSLVLRLSQACVRVMRVSSKIKQLPGLLVPFCLVLSVLQGLRSNQRNSSLNQERLSLSQYEFIFKGKYKEKYTKTIKKVKVKSSFEACTIFTIIV